MSADEEFTRALRKQVDAVAPSVDVDTSRVIPRARRRRRGARARGVAGTLVMVAGIAWVVASMPSALPPASDVSPTPYTIGVSALDLEYRQRTLAALAEEFGLVDPPAIEPVQWFDGADQGPFLASCLTDAGFTVTLRQTGDFDVEYSDAQESAYGEAQYRCQAMYPMRAPLTDPPPEEYVRELYEYRSEVLVECFAEYGYIIDDAPSWEKFRDDTYAQNGEQWNPWSTLLRQYSHTLDFDKMEVACPQAQPNR